MLTRMIAQSLMAVVPDKHPATVTLSPDSTAPITVQIFNAWIKPLNVTRSTYDTLNLQGDETLIKIPQHELNSSNNGYEIRARDQISIQGTTYRVLMSTLKSVRTVWECVVRKEML
jgi:hypothetical protein